MTAYEMRISDWSSDVCSSDLDIGAVAIEARRREEMAAVDGYPLRLVDRRRVAMIEIAIIFDVECDAAPVINANRHALFADPLDRPERAILHLQAALVAPEQHEIGRATCRERVCQYV